MCDFFIPVQMTKEADEEEEEEKKTANASTKFLQLNVWNIRMNPMFNILHHNTIPFLLCHCLSDYMRRLLLLMLLMLLMLFRVSYLFAESVRFSSLRFCFLFEYLRDGTKEQNKKLKHSKKH